MKTLKSSFPQSLATPFKTRKAKLTVFKGGSTHGKQVVISRTKGQDKELQSIHKATGILADAKASVREEKETKERLDAAVALKVKMGFVRLPLKSNGQVYFVQPRTEKGHFGQKVILGNV